MFLFLHASGKVFLPSVRTIINGEEFIRIFIKGNQRVVRRCKTVDTFSIFMCFLPQLVLTVISSYVLRYLCGSLTLDIFNFSFTNMVVASSMIPVDPLDQLEGCILQDEIYQRLLHLLLTLGEELLSRCCHHVLLHL